MKKDRKIEGRRTTRTKEIDNMTPQEQTYKHLCDKCKKLPDCESWLKLMRSDNIKDLGTYGVHTITLVYDCRDFIAKEAKDDR